jgi:hypothetical protein
VARLPRVEAERLPEGLNGNTALSAVSIVIFYAIIQQAVYGRTTLRQGDAMACVPRSACSALLVRTVRQSDHDRRSVALRAVGVAL